jgi:hypothetical protein
MPSTEMTRFRQLVFTRPELREALRGYDGDQEFVMATIALAATLDIKLAEDDVREALNAGQRDWLERWL